MVPMDLCLSSGMDPVADRRETGRMFLHYGFYLDPGAKVLGDEAFFAGVMDTENDGLRVLGSQLCDTCGYYNLCTPM